MDHKLENNIFQLRVIELDYEHALAMYQGRKRIEVRKNSSTWKGIKEGHEIVIAPKYVIKAKDNLIPPEEISRFRVMVKRVQVYSGKDPLLNLLFSEGISNVLPNVDTLTEAISVYLKYWSVEEMRNLGLLAIEVEVL